MNLGVLHAHCFLYLCELNFVHFRQSFFGVLFWVVSSFVRFFWRVGVFCFAFWRGGFFFHSAFTFSLCMFYYLGVVMRHHVLGAWEFFWELYS